MTTDVLSATGVSIRHEFRPGDIGLIAKRNGELYAAEYGWDITVEALAANLLTSLITLDAPLRERRFIAEIDGAFAGCVFLVKGTEEQARLRSLLVEPYARGHGLGSRLVQECVEFARAAGYRSIALWTMSALVPARRIYARAGFRCVESWHDPRFGVADLISETWEMTL